MTAPHNCSYLDSIQATTAFVDPDVHVDGQLYSRLSEMGFRRSGPYLYKPHCSHCQSCVPARIPVQQFKPSRSQSRCWKHNKDIMVEQVSVINEGEHFSVYERYISQRHFQGDMYPPTKQQFRDFLGKPWDCTRFLEFRLDEQLLGCAVIDVIQNGISAIYTYFSPEHASRGLGNLAILFQIAMAKKLGLEYIYLGYWIKGCQKMSYKTNFRPLELYRQNAWQLCE